MTVEKLISQLQGMNPKAGVMINAYTQSPTGGMSITSNELKVVRTEDKKGRPQVCIFGATKVEH